MRPRLSSAVVFAKWGLAAAVLAALTVGAAGQPPSYPDLPDLPSATSIPPGPPSLDPSGPIGTDDLDPSSPPSSDRPDRPGPGTTPLPGSVSVALKLERDGRLTVSESVFVGAGDTMTRRVPLRVRAGDDGDRVFTVRDPKVNGDGRTELTDDEYVMTFSAGAATITYTVDGVVQQVDGHQQVRWQVASGWDATLRLLRASFLSPKQPQSVICLAGKFGTDTKCEQALTDHGQVLRVVESDLDAGDRVDLAVQLPAGTVEANAAFDDTATTTAAFAITMPSGIGLGLLVLSLLAGFVLLLLARGRDAKALATDVGPVELLVRNGDRVSFASPDGVLPGQIGTVVDEKVDVADVTATVVDLAVRNYLSIRAVTQPDGSPDWQLVRRNPPDAALTGYERAVYDAVLGDAESVSLATLRVTPPNLSAARDGLYADVVSRQWFARRPDHDRTRWVVVGAVLAVLGIAATVVLALTVGHALLGVAVLIAGIALALGARSMPARTRRGSVLVQQVRGLLGYLRADDPGDVPAVDKEMVLSRSLPYAVVLGESQRWLDRFTTLDTAADGTPGIYWYEPAVSQDGTGGHDQFARDFPAFLRALDAVLAASGHVR
jgi:predicted membrane protein DUF2207